MQPVSETDGAGNHAMDSPSRSPKFVEHLAVATVAESAEGGIVDELVQELKNTAMEVPGVLAAHVGRCEPMLGDGQTLMMHIRAVDTASSDAACTAASEVYGKHVSLHDDMGTSEGLFGDVSVVDFSSDGVIGAWDAKWPAIRIAIFQYKVDISEAKKEALIRALKLLPTLFPCVKQVSWGRNVAKQRAYTTTKYGYADADLGVILGFSSCHDMQVLGDDPKYWELLNFHGISLLDHYQVLTLCLT